MFDKKIDIPANLRYTYKYEHIRDLLIRSERGGNCPRTQTVTGFGSVLSEKSRRGQWPRGFAGFWG